MSSALRTAPVITDPQHPADQTGEVALQLTNVNLYYGAVRAVKDITLEIKARAITSIIGPSGCGKSTLLRTLNRINDRVSGFRVEGAIKLGDLNISDPKCDIVDLRRRSGMVFQYINGRFG